MFHHLSDIGLVMNTDGTLQTKATALDNGMANLAELRKLFATDGTSSAASGFMVRLKKLGDAALDTSGVFQTRNDSLQAQVTSMDQRQAQIQSRLTQTEQRLRAQYTALDANMSKLTALSNYVTQQLSGLTTSSSK
jgi:flagellar hook-associated protein 2